jgi:hypothetical protein
MEDNESLGYNFLLCDSQSVFINLSQALGSEAQLIWSEAKLIQQPTVLEFRNGDWTFIFDRHSEAQEVFFYVHDGSLTSLKINDLKLS